MSLTYFFAFVALVAAIGFLFTVLKDRESRKQAL